MIHGTPADLQISIHIGLLSRCSKISHVRFPIGRQPPVCQLSRVSKNLPCQPKSLLFIYFLFSISQGVRAARIILFRTRVHSHFDPGVLSAPDAFIVIKCHSVYC